MDGRCGGPGNYGHNDVKALHGGLRSWALAGNPLEEGTDIPAPARFAAHVGFAPSWASWSASAKAASGAINDYAPIGAIGPRGPAILELSATG